MTNQDGFQKKVACPLYLLVVTLAVVALTGTVTHGVHLLQHFYLWPLIRLVGYSSLLVYALLLLKGARYNTGS